MRKNCLKSVAIMLLASVFVFGCGSSQAKQEAAAPSAAPAASTAADSGATAAAASTEAGPTIPEVTVTAEELAKPDVTVAYDDFEAMEKLSKSIQNGEMVDKIVEIDGEVANFGSSASIGEKNAADDKRVGTVYVIKDSESKDDYLPDKTRVKITGKVGTEDGFSFMIYTLKEFVVAQ